MSSACQIFSVGFIMPTIDGDPDLPISGLACLGAGKKFEQVR